MAQQEQPLPGLEQIAGKQPEIYQIFRQVWNRISQLSGKVASPLRGTLNPDQKPQLGPEAVDSKFYATDFNRTYRWTGSAWQDAPDAPARFLIAYFAAAPEPSVGWAKCNGASVFRSTSDGRTAFFEVPNVAPDDNGFSAWIRV